MIRTAAACLLASVIALTLGACGDDSSSGYASAGSYGGSGSSSSCSTYTTCGTCTPVEGCGWCFSGSTGVCTSRPDRCSDFFDAGEFTWTWNDTGCPDVDASVAPAPLDAGTTTTTEASTAQEASVADTGSGEAATVDAAGDGRAAP